MKRLLIAAHAPSDNTQELLRSIEDALSESDFDQLKVSVASPFDIQADDLLAADGVVVLTTENFGYMAGATKDMFDRCYIECLDRTEGKPWCLIVRAGSDGTGTVNSIETIVTGLRWKRAQEALVVQGDYDVSYIDGTRDYVLAFAHQLDSGMV